MPRFTSRTPGEMIADQEGRQVSRLVGGGRHDEQYIK